MGRKWKKDEWRKGKGKKKIAEPRKGNSPSGGEYPLGKNETTMTGRFVWLSKIAWEANGRGKNGGEVRI